MIVLLVIIVVVMAARSRRTARRTSENNRSDLVSSSRQVPAFTNPFYQSSAQVRTEVMSQASLPAASNYDNRVNEDSYASVNYDEPASMSSSGLTKQNPLYDEQEPRTAG